MQRNIYPSDITLEQFKIIKNILEGAKKKTRPRKVDLYDVFCGLLYIIKSGCQWRMLPSDFPSWKLVHYYFMVWSYKKNKDSPSTLEKVLKKIGQKRTFEKWKELQHEFGYY
jgi:transposase